MDSYASPFTGAGHASLKLDAEGEPILFRAKLSDKWLQWRAR